MKIKIVYPFLITLVLVALAACSPKRNTFASRQYHDVTAYFNVLFNGRDTYNLSAKKAEKTEPAGFDEILPVFAFEFESVPGALSSDMQRTIEKSNKTIEKHSITAKPKKKKNMTKEERDFYNKREYCLWIDDAHLLIGKANVYLQEYAEAARVFEFVNSEYPKESGIYESKLWLAIVQAQRGDIGIAENSLKLLEKDKKFPEKLYPLLQAAWADIKIKQKNYPEAAAYLEKTLEKHQRKATQIRYNYILAQLYERIGDKNKAMAYYNKVMKMNPPYFTAFNAEMATVLLYDSTTQKSDIRKTLEKALKNEKNADYQDQIYFALATLEKNDNNIAKAMEYYQKSINTTNGNNRQKALAYNALGDYFYSKPDYVKAYHYYDSSAQTVGANHSRYEEMLGKAKRLKKLATNLEIVQQQDSLQQIAKLSPRERDKLIEKKISDAKAAEEAQQQMAEQPASANRLNTSTMQESAQSASGQWYFYNTTALSLGLSDFQMRWGRRKLEDNWRRRNRSLMALENIADQEFDRQQSESLTISDAEKQKKGLTNKDKEFYLLDVPVGDEAIKESDKNILHAMYNVGEAFRDDLNNNSSSIKAFEDMNSRFPNSELQPASYIDLYKLYIEQGNTDKANYYKNLMTQMYSNNPQVKAALDPSYVIQMQAQATAAENAYMEAVNKYTQGQRAQAWQMAEDAINNGNTSKLLLPQYYLLRVLSADYSGNEQQYQTAMQEMIQKFPKTDAAKRAQEMLDELAASKKTSTTTADKATKAEQPIVEQPVTVNYSAEDGAHYFAVLLTPKGDMNQMKFNVTSFNADTYLNENYEVSDKDMGKNYKLLLVGVFRNKEAAMKYYRNVMDNSEVFKGQASASYLVCVISETNLFLLKDNRYFTPYYAFFQKNY